MSRDVLTPRRKQILEFIQRHISRYGYPPTVREIGEAVSLTSPSTVHAHLRRLQQAGLIAREKMLTRAIRPVGDAAPEMPSAPATVPVPIVGRVAAGTPILAEQDIEGYFGVPGDMVEAGGAFLLQTRGDSMIDAGIYDGDYVLVRRQSNADNGDIVVAMLEGESTVKRFFKESGAIRLQPENQTLKPIVSRDVQVLGKVVGLFRRLS